MKQKKKKTSLVSKAFLKKLNQELAVMSDSRDELRNLMHEIESQIDAADQGIEALEQAIDYFSQYN